MALKSEYVEMFIDGMTDLLIFIAGILAVASIWTDLADTMIFRQVMIGIAVGILASLFFFNKFYKQKLRDSYKKVLELENELARIKKI